MKKLLLLISCAALIAGCAPETSKKQNGQTASAEAAAPVLSTDNLADIKADMDALAEFTKKQTEQLRPFYERLEEAAKNKAENPEKFYSESSTYMIELNKVTSDFGKLPVKSKEFNEAKQKMLVAYELQSELQNKGLLLDASKKQPDQETMLEMQAIEAKLNYYALQSNALIYKLEQRIEPLTKTASAEQSSEPQAASSAAATSSEPKAAEPKPDTASKPQTDSGKTEKKSK